MEFVRRYVGIGLVLALYIETSVDSGVKIAEISRDPKYEDRKSECIRFSYHSDSGIFLPIR